MGIQDRDWYREEHANKNARERNSLHAIANGTVKRRRTSKIAMALVWTGIIAALYYAFTLAGQLTH